MGVAAFSGIVGIFPGTTCLWGNNSFAYDHDLFDGHDSVHCRVCLSSSEKIEHQIMGKLQDDYKVISNEPVCAKFYHLRIDANPIVETALPGQFIHIRINDGLEPFFRRPFSIYRAKKSDCENCQIVVNTLQKTVYLYQRVGEPPEIPQDVRKRLFKRLNLDEFIKDI